jgi:Asp/Glu/hydantoin racemase
MAEKAVNIGKQIGVIATLATTLEPTCDLIEKKAETFGKNVSISRKLCGDAFERLTQGDREGHDELIMNAVCELNSDHDVIVLSQASMARLVETIDDIQVPVLSSPESGLEWVRKKLISHGLAK